MEEMPLLDPSRPVAIPMFHLPIFRTQVAIQRGVEKNLLFRTWGGLGDQICAEPTLRYALKHFGKDCKISLASERPELFKHLEFEKVFNLNEVIPNHQNYLVFETITPPDNTNLVWQFFSHMLVNCVDFPSLCALRCQLPNDDKRIYLRGTPPKNYEYLLDSGAVFIHPGRHWPSKTFPKDFWDHVIQGLVKSGVIPVIIGANTDKNRGTVDVDTNGCVDLRNKLSVSESVWLLQRARVLLTNDSSPLHMAASEDPIEGEGCAWIGFIASCKHPDYITHWRKGSWQWREHNFGKGGIWDIISHCPNAKQEVTAEFVDENVLRSWLPNPEEMIEWTKEKLHASN